MTLPAPMQHLEEVRGGGVGVVLMWTWAFLVVCVRDSCVEAICCPALLLTLCLARALTLSQPPFSPPRLCFVPSLLRTQKLSDAVTRPRQASKIKSTTRQASKIKRTTYGLRSTEGNHCRRVTCRQAETPLTLKCGVGVISPQVRIPKEPCKRAL